MARLHPMREEIGFWRQYIFATDHKVIGIQYALTAMFFLLFGFFLVMLMRWQLAFPGTQLPIIGEALLPGGIITPEIYNSLGAMHGTIMVFLGVVPLAVGGFGNYFLPLQIGAVDMAFPKLNMASYWVYFVGGLVMLGSFLLPGGAANSGWTSYPPLANVATIGQTVWIFGMVCIITSSLLGSINFIVTTVQLRTKGLSMFRLPIFVWSQLMAAFLLLLALPPLEAAGILQLMDRLLGTSFFMPSGLIISGEPMKVSGGGNPLLWQHLFWFLGHPEVYVLILPGVGIIAEVLSTNTRRPIYGYNALVYSMIFLGFMSFIVWAHHMYFTGMGTMLTSFFQATTMIISIPSVIILTVYILTLWGASIRYPVSMCFAIAFLPMFAIGGLTGLPLGVAASGISLHDTYYVIGHFHYVIAPGTIFALFAGVYHWYPKVTGRMLSERLGKFHFWASLIFMNGIFFPMLFMGMAGVSRRLYDPTGYAHARTVQPLNVVMSISAWCLALVQLAFLINFFISLKRGKKVTSDNPWDSTTLEWVAPTPPPHGNFTKPVAAYRGPYEYNVVPQREFFPQNLQEA